VSLRLSVLGVKKVLAAKNISTQRRKVREIALPIQDENYNMRLHLEAVTV